MLKEHIEAMRRYEGVPVDAPLDLQTIRLALKWMSSGTPAGNGYEDYKLIPIDEEYATKIYQGYDLVVKNGLMEYVKGA